MSNTAEEMNGRRLNEPTAEQMKAQLLKLLEECNLWTMTKRIVYRNLAAHFAIRATRLAPFKPMIRQTIKQFCIEKYGSQCEDTGDGVAGGGGGGRVDGSGGSSGGGGSGSGGTPEGPDQVGTTVPIMARNEDIAYNDSIEDDYDSDDVFESDEDYVDDDEEAVSDDEDSDYDLSKEVRIPKDLRKKKSRNAPNEDGDNPRGGRRRVYLNAFERGMILAEPLSEFMGELVQSRTNCMKRVHAHIKENDLRDSTNRQIVICDDALRKLFKVDEFSNMTLTKLLTDLLYKPEEVGDNRYNDLLQECNDRELAAKLKRAEEHKRSRSTKRRYKKRVIKREGSDNESKSPRKKPRGIHALRRLSPALVEICGVPVMSRQDAVRKIWEYIRENDLNAKSRIRLDSKLKAVFGDVTSITNLEVFKRLDGNFTNL